MPTIEPAFGLPAVWIGEAQREQAEVYGYTVVDPTSLIVTHLTEVDPPHAAELLGRQDVRQLLDPLKERHPGAGRGARARPADARRGAARAADAPARRRVPIRDLVTILETLGDKAKLTKDSPILAEYCRQALARAICGRLRGRDRDDARDHARPGDRPRDRRVRPPHGGRHPGGDGPRPGLRAHRRARRSRWTTRSSWAPRRSCSRSGATRRHLKALVSHAIPNLTVLSYHEILPSVRIEPVGLAALV